jgi:hypothetical protein
VSKATISAQEFIDMVAAEMSAGVCFAVESWMAQVEQAVNDPRLTTLGRMNSVKKVVNNYRCMKGNDLRESRSLQGAVR